VYPALPNAYSLPSHCRTYLVANIGLCLFLFIVGLEIDASIIKRNARMSAIVSLVGMALPFGVGSALSVPLYHHFIDPSVQFTHFMLYPLSRTVSYSH
jgi:Kef-type K+ transport system membrane component KefB